jgi:uncharacterized membrane-anchored protein YhcB (DUF1043 family)
MWDWAIWAALIVGVIAGILATVRLVRRVRETLRDAEYTRRDTVRRIDEFTAKAEAAAERIDAVGDTAELQESLGRLRVSLARLAVLRAALDEARFTFGPVATFLPRK